MELSAVLRQDNDKPTFHILPQSGWINDPNGPVFYNGMYHLFYQHIINGCEWDFGIVWGHAVSRDMVHWEHLPPALMPTPGGLDADGCFSGCCVVDTNGVPTILYTGVRLRSNPDCGPLPPPEQDLQLPFVESQLAAIPEAAYSGEHDPLLANWEKTEQPFLAYPPPDMGLVGWRDPFIFEFKGQEGKQEWGMLLGSGIKGKGGAVMIYRSPSLHDGWRYEGMLCESDVADTGAMWECPLLAPLPVVPERARPLPARGAGPVSGPGSLTSAFEAGSAFAAANGGGAHSVNSTAAWSPDANFDRKTRAGMAAARPAEQQTGFSLSSPPRAGVGLGPRRTTAIGNLAQAAAEPWRVDGPPPGGGGDDSDSGAEEGGSSKGGGDIEARRAKSLLSEALLNPYADEESSADGDATMETPRFSNGLAANGRDEQGLEPDWEEAAAAEARARLRRASYDSARARASAPRVQFTHLLCISPDAPTNPVLYWLSTFDAAATRFLLGTAKGPLRLDLGDTLYAPNLMLDEQGRYIMWGWLQERRKVGSYDYAGCLSLPRVLYICGDRLIQEPAPEVNKLRRGECWRASQLQIFAEEATPLEGVAGAALDIVCVLERGDATAAGLLLRSWNAGGEGGAAILYDWERGVLEAVFEGGAGLDLATQPELDAGVDGQRRIGGPVDLRPGEALTMRVLVDHSCVEVYLSSGEVLSTRVYRGVPPHGCDAGIDFVAYGGTARAERVEAWEVSSIWQRQLVQEGPKSSASFTMYEPINTVMPVGSPVAV